MELKRKLLKGLLTTNLVLAGLAAVTIPTVALAQTIPVQIGGTIQPTSSVIDIELSKTNLDLSMLGSESQAADTFKVTNRSTINIDVTPKEFIQTGTWKPTLSTNTTDTEFNNTKAMLLAGVEKNKSPIEFDVHSKLDNVPTSLGVGEYAEYKFVLLVAPNRSDAFDFGMSFDIVASPTAQ